MAGWATEVKKRFRYVIEAVITTVLFFRQRVPMGAWGMLLPLTKLILYIPHWITYPELLRYEVFYRRLSTIVGRFGLIIAVVGLAIFIKSFIKLLKRRGKLVTTGLYSVVRHPQYLGITLTALGTSILLRGYAADLLFAVIGYILLAGYEERNLLREHKGKYLEYKQRTPFIFPVSCPSKINEFLYSLILAALIFIVTFGLTFISEPSVLLSVYVVPLIVTIALSVLVIRKELLLMELLAVISGGVTGFLIGRAVAPLWTGVAQMGALIGSTLMVVVLIAAHAIKAIFSKERQ